MAKDTFPVIISLQQSAIQELAGKKGANLSDARAQASDSLPEGHFRATKLDRTDLPRTEAFSL